MLCNKIEINESERFTQTIEKKKRIRALHESKDEHSHIRVSFRELHSEKNLQTIALHRFTQNLEISYHSCRQEGNFKENLKNQYECS